MKTLVIISAANESIKSVANNLREANREYTSLSRVLKDIQRRDMMKSGYMQVFETVGMPIDGKITPAMFFGVLTKEQQGQTYNKAGEVVGEPWFGIWGTRQKKNENGEKVYDENGAPVIECVLRKVTSWTPNKLFKMLAQAQAIKANR